MWGIFTLLTIVAALWVVIPWLDRVVHEPRLESEEEDDPDWWA